jgi:hypothetical protein
MAARSLNEVHDTRDAQPVPEYPLDTSSSQQKAAVLSQA